MKRHMTKAEAIPPAVNCDFCSQSFTPPRWNCRTCHRCAAQGLPDQSVGTWEAYSKTIADRARELGVKPSLSGAAAVRRQNALQQAISASSLR